MLCLTPDISVEEGRFHGQLDPDACHESQQEDTYVPFRFPSIFLGNRRTIDIMDNAAFIGNICCRKLGGRVICVYVIDYETKHEMNTNKNIYYYPIYIFLHNQFL